MMGRFAAFSIYSEPVTKCVYLLYSYVALFLGFAVLSAEVHRLECPFGFIYFIIDYSWILIFVQFISLVLAFQSVYAQTIPSI